MLLSVRFWPEILKTREKHCVFHKSAGDPGHVQASFGEKDFIPRHGPGVSPCPFSRSVWAARTFRPDARLDSSAAVQVKRVFWGKMRSQWPVA